MKIWHTQTIGICTAVKIFAGTDCGLTGDGYLVLWLSSQKKPKNGNKGV